MPLPGQQEAMDARKTTFGKRKVEILKMREALEKFVEELIQSKINPHAGSGSLNREAYWAQFMDALDAYDSAKK